MIEQQCFSNLRLGETPYFNLSIPRPPTFLQICMREGHYQGHTLKANNLEVRGGVKA